MKSLFPKGRRYRITLTQRKDQTYYLFFWFHKLQYLYSHRAEDTESLFPKGGSNGGSS